MIELTITRDGVWIEHPGEQIATVSLPRRAHRLLLELAKKPDEVQTKTKLCHRLRMSTHQLDSACVEARQALAQHGLTGPQFVWGVGFRLRHPDPDVPGFRLLP